MNRELEQLTQGRMERDPSYTPLERVLMEMNAGQCRKDFWEDFRQTIRPLRWVALITVLAAAGLVAWP